MKLRKNVEFTKTYDNGKYGFVDNNSKKICEIKYDFVFNFWNGFAEVEIAGKYGYIDENGIEVVPCVYSITYAEILLEKYKLKLLRIQKLKTII